MKRFLLFGALLGAVVFSVVAQQPATPPAPAAAGGGRGPVVVTAKPEDLAKFAEKAGQIEALVKELRAKKADATLIGDVDVFAKAGRFLIEYPDMFGNPAAIDHAMTVLDSGIERGKQLLAGKSPWTEGKSRTYAYYSAIDGAVLPYHVSLPANYDPAKPTRLYVWMHGRQNNTTEAEFIFGFMNPRPANPPVADQGQIQLDLFGRINSAGWHWAGEADVVEAIAAVKQRFKIDDKRIMLRGFSQGGEGAWHFGLHHPDLFAAVEIGAGTWSRRSQMPGLQPYQYSVLKIWENMEEWALNAFNLPLAAHDGDNDTQTAVLPSWPPGTPHRGQLESSLRARAQLEKEGFVAEGEPDYLKFKGIPAVFLISQNTGHGTSPLVRQRLDAFLKEWGDKGQISPDHLRFLTYTTRYNRDYWASVDGMEKLYERAEIDIQRVDGAQSYTAKTKNVTRLALREMDKAQTITIDGQTLKLKSAPEITLRKIGTNWKLDKNGPLPGLNKSPGLQGPIDDAFLDPFLLVRPTGTPWNEAVNDQALRTMKRFDRLWGRFFRGHPYVKDDKDVTEADFAKYHVVLFGDPGSNKWIAKMAGKLPVKWTKESVVLGNRTLTASEHFPAMIYPNPLHPGKYVVINTGLTIPDREYNGDYGMPLWGDYAIVRANPTADVGDMVVAGLFDQKWQLPK